MDETVRDDAMMILSDWGSHPNCQFSSTQVKGAQDFPGSAVKKQ
jgi:hypothetical protein